MSPLGWQDENKFQDEIEGRLGRGARRQETNRQNANFIFSSFWRRDSCNSTSATNAVILAADDDYPDDDDADDGDVGGNIVSLLLQRELQ